MSILCIEVLHNFGVTSNVSIQITGSKNSQLAIAVKSLQSFIGFFKQPLVS